MTWWALVPVAFGVGYFAGALHVGYLEWRRDRRRPVVPSPFGPLRGPSDAELRRAKREAERGHRGTEAS